MDALCLHFATYGIPEELATDGGPEFTAAITVQFLKDWGIHHRLSSVAFPHSNCRAEMGVKSIKRFLAGNISASGNLNTDAFQCVPSSNTVIRRTLLPSCHQLCVYSAGQSGAVALEVTYHISHPASRISHPAYCVTCCHISHLASCILRHHFCRFLHTASPFCRFLHTASLRPLPNSVMLPEKSIIAVLLKVSQNLCMLL